MMKLREAEEQRVRRSMEFKQQMKDDQEKWEKTAQEAKEKLE